MVALLSALRRDVTSFWEQLQPVQPPRAGLYTFRIARENQQQTRLHLRIEPSGDAVLFVDVTDAIHLNPMAAEMAWWALSEVPLDQAARRLRSRYRRDAESRWQDDLHAVYAMVRQFVGERDGCPTCSLAGLEKAALFSTRVGAPFKADLALTYDCNNDCPHCYNEADRLAMGLLSAREWQRIIDTLCQAGVPHFILTGGEATLHPDLLEIIHYADQAGPICGLNTNGRRLAQAGYAAELKAAGLNHVQFTLGSHQPDVHDRMMNARSFHQTVRGIENALQAGLHVITNTTLMQMNSADIESTVEFLHRLGIRTFAVNGMIYSGGGFATGQAIPEERMPPILIRIRDKAAEMGMRFLWYTPTQYCRLSPVELEIGAKRCNAGEYSLCVEPNGDILPCQSFYSAAGNLLRDPWERIWHSDLFLSFRRREEDPAGCGLPEMCWECPELSLCGGGCRIEREAQEGNRAAGGCSGCSSGGCSSSVPAGFVSLDSLTVRQRRRGSGEFAAASSTPTS